MDRLPPDPSTRLRIAALTITGIALAVLVGRDGSPGWLAVRVAIVIAVTGSLILLISRVRRGPGVWVLLPAGLVGTAVGAGITPPWLTKAGLGIVSVAGILSLVGGLSLLGFAAVDLAGALRGWRRAAAIVLLLPVAVVVVFSLGVAVAATNVPPTELSAHTPADRGLDFATVEFETADGVALAGWYLPSQNGAGVVLAHGAGSTRISVLEHAEVLAGHGYGVLLYDARGHGRSGGRAMDLGWYGDEDVGAAVRYLSTRSDVEPERIGAVGLSMGGEQVIGAAAADTRIAGVVAEGATARTADDKDWLSEEHGAQGWIQERIDDLTFWLTDLLTESGPPITLREAAARAAPRPMLLIAAAGVADEPAAARYIREGSPGTVEVWVVPDAGHTRGLATAPAEWEEQVIGFLDRVLGGR